jgi:hypothetical protein
MVIICIKQTFLDPIDDLSDEEIPAVLADGAVNSNDKCKTQKT